MMPECYEVLRIKDYLLDSQICNQAICNVNVTEKGARLFKNASKEDVVNFLLQNSLTAIFTKAKYTLFKFSHGAMLCHYRFTGIPHVTGHSYKDRLNTIYNLPTEVINDDYIRFSIFFENGKQLNYVDTRCLSHIHISLEAQSFSDFKSTQLLPEDMTQFIFPSFKKWTSQTNNLSLDLKSYLLNQYYAPSGIGNYLACEICHHAGLNPWKKVGSFSEIDYFKLVDGYDKVKVYCESHNDYVWFKVYNQINCVSCNHIVSKKRHKGKSSQTTTWCSICQH